MSIDFDRRLEIYAELAVRITVRDPEGALHARPALETALHFWSVAALAALADTGWAELMLTVDTSSDAVEVVAAGRGGTPVDPERTVALRDRAEALDGALAVELSGGQVRLRAHVPLGTGEVS